MHFDAALAKSVLSRLFSASSRFDRRASETSMTLNLAFRLADVGAPMPCSRQPLPVFAPASCAHRTPTMCVSRNRDPLHPRRQVRRTLLTTEGGLRAYVKYVTESYRYMTETPTDACFSFAAIFAMSMAKLPAHRSVWRS